MAEIEIKNLTKHYGKTLAVNNVSLKVDSGTFTVILGPSGSGKTTLLRCVAGFETPDGGTISIDGVLSNELPPRERDLAMVFQDYALFPLKTIHDNIGFPLEVRKRPKAEIDSRVKVVADLLGIKHLLEKRPSQLSGGEQQRAALGRAIVREPKALLMDEPLTNLDAPLRAQMRTELKRIRRETKMTAIYVTHDQAEAMGLADMLAIMSDGELEQYAKPMDVYSRPGNTFVAGFVGNPPMNLITVRISTKDGKELLQNGGFSYRAEPRVLELVRQQGGGEVILGIRPEDTRVFSSRNSENSAECVVESVEQLGPNTVVSTNVEDATFKTIVPPEKVVRPGDRIWLEWDANRLHMFDGKTSSLMM